MKLSRLTNLDQLKEELTPVTIEGIELVVVKQEEIISVFSGKCLHDGASLGHSGFLDGGHITCGRHLWRYHINTGELDGEKGVFLKKLNIQINNRDIFIDLDELDELKDIDWE